MSRFLVAMFALGLSLAECFVPGTLHVTSSPGLRVGGICLGVQRPRAAAGEKSRQLQQAAYAQLQEMVPFLSQGKEERQFTLEDSRTDFTKVESIRRERQLRITKLKKAMQTNTSGTLDETVPTNFLSAAATIATLLGKFILSIVYFTACMSLAMALEFSVAFVTCRVGHFDTYMLVA
jgi:hypothetical protein